MSQNNDIIRYEVYYQNTQFVGAIDIPRKNFQFFNVWDLCVSDAATRFSNTNSNTVRYYTIVGKTVNSCLCVHDSHDIVLGHVSI